MKRFLSTITAAGALAGFAFPVAADVTPDEVWQELQRRVALYGVELTVGNEVPENGKLTLRDVSFLGHNENVSSSGHIAYLELTENADGSVSIQVAPEMTTKTKVIPADGNIIDLATRTLSDGLLVVASGNPDAIKLDFTAKAISVRGTNAETSADSQEFSLDVANMSGTSSFGSGASTEVISTSKADNFVFSTTVTPPEDDVEVSIKHTFSNPSMTSTYKLPEGQALSEYSPILGKELTGHGQIDFASTTSSILVNPAADGDRFALNASSLEGYLSYSLVNGMLEYKTSAANGNVAVETSALPIPGLGFSVGKASSSFSMPIVKSETATDFATEIRLQDLLITDQVWSLFDPLKALPRDPGDVVVSLSGKGKLLIDVFDPDLAENPAAMTSPPAAIDEIGLNELLINFAGATLSGDGAVRFGQSAPNGRPMPEGLVNLKLIGANALIGKLVQIGLIPQQQAVTATMMMGVFATPGEGEDTLVSQIEMQKGGAILANGQRIR